METVSVMARIVPAQPAQRPKEWPDFATRRKKIFGDRVFSNATQIRLTMCHAS